MDSIVKTNHYWQNCNDFKMNGHGVVGRRKWLMKIINLYNPKSVLEIGCYDGTNLRLLHQLNPKIKLTGIDINVSAIERAKVLLPEAKFECGNMYEIDKFFKEKFDLVFTRGVMIYIFPTEAKNFIDKIISLSRKTIVHCEHHSEKFIERQYNDNSTVGRRSSNYLELYRNYDRRIYSRTRDSSGGGHH